MDEQQRKAMLKETFDTISGGYDIKLLRFFGASADHMAVLLGLQGHEHVLDVACGTGHAALAMAKFLTTGCVKAVDFSPGMIEQARRKAASFGISNVEFIERDMQNLNFSDDLFDVAVCAFGIFFVEDMVSQLSHIASFVKPGGRVMISSFREGSFQPFKDMFNTRFETYGKEMPPQTSNHIESKMDCIELFKQAGLTNISVTEKNVGYNLGSKEQWWDVVWNTGFRSMLDQLSSRDLERFKREHLDEVEAFRTREGIWLEVGVLFTEGTKQY